MAFEYSETQVDHLGANRVRKERQSNAKVDGGKLLQALPQGRMVRQHDHFPPGVEQHSSLQSASGPLRRQGKQIESIQGQERQGFPGHRHDDVFARNRPSKRGQNQQGILQN